MDVAGTFQTWLNVLTHPDEATFAQEQSKPNATLGTALIWIVIAAVISAIFGFVGGALIMSSQAPMFQNMLDQMELPPEAKSQLGAILSGGMMTGLMGAGSLFGIILSPIVFLIGAGILHLIARMLGGQGEYGKYAYLLALFQAPLSILQSIIGLVPFLGGCIVFISWIYSLVLTYYATKVGHGLSSGKAITVVVIPIVLAILLFACVFIGAIVMLGSTMDR
jgi:hypothetical protein